jgi:LmbE family N-acetylglucosaminyl deacetylase
VERLETATTGAARLRVLCVSAHCVLDGADPRSAALRAALEAMARRGYDVRVLCSSVTASESGQRLLERAPIVGAWRADEDPGPHPVRGGVLHGVRYRVMTLASWRAGELRALDRRMLFLALLDLERQWPPQALLTAGSGLLVRLLQLRATRRGLPARHWPAPGAGGAGGAEALADALEAAFAASGPH